MTPTSPLVLVEARPADPRPARASRQPLRFAVLALQLALLLVVFKLYNVEQPVFLIMMTAAFAAFGVHYWLPFAWKEPFWIAASIGSSFLLVHWLVAAGVLAIGLAFFGVFCLPLAYRLRAGLAVALFAGLMYLSTRPPAAWLTELCGEVGSDWLAQLWPVFGGLFMFRIVVYLYDLRHFEDGPKLQAYLAYFFLLPNYIFLLFPVVDYQTMRKSYFRRDVHAIAQQGVHWIVRGTVQLLLYRVIYHEVLPAQVSPDAITSLGSLVVVMIATYLLYLRLSGLFHIIIGVMHLFGYDLPETHRNYLLARSLTDFWRRINIYWKDFMVKTVFFPVFFRLRKTGEMRAQVIATALVFFVTWATHSYQVFWLTGSFHVTWNDTLFWGILGLLVIANLFWEQRRGGGRKAAPGRLAAAGQVLATFSLITFLWFMWQKTSLREWLDLLTWWSIG